MGKSRLGKVASLREPISKEQSLCSPFFVAVTVNLLSHSGRKITGQKHPLGTSERNISAVLQFNSERELKLGTHENNRGELHDWVWSS